MVTHAEFFGHVLRAKKQLETDSPCLLHFLDECEQQSINSHTISKNCLRILADKGQLITPKPVPTKSSEESPTRFQNRGIKRASTYRGFCETHDNNLFDEIDKIQDDINLDKIMLFFLRSLGQEYQKKIRAFATLDAIKVFDMNLNDDELHNYEVSGQLLGANILWQQFSEVYRAIKNNTHRDFRYLTINFNHRFPFSFLGCYSHELEYMEVELGDRNPINFRSCVMGFVPTDNGSTFFMGWHKNYTPYVSRFLTNLERTKGAVPEYIFQYAIAVTENIFINPNWYDQIGGKWREGIENYFRTTTRGYANFAHRSFPGILSNLKYKLRLKTNTLKVKKWARKNKFSQF